MSQTTTSDFCSLMPQSISSGLTLYHVPELRHVIFTRSWHVADLHFVNSVLSCPKQLLVTSTLSCPRATARDLHSLVSLCSNIRYLTSYVLTSYSIGIVSTYVPKLKQYVPFIISRKSCPEAPSGRVYHVSSTSKSHVSQMCINPCMGGYVTPPITTPT